MSSTQQMENNSIDISSMLNDVNKVLHTHLNNILTPMLQEKQNIRKVLLNMPMVKHLQEEHLKSQQAAYAIQAEAKALKLFYEGEIAQLKTENSKLTNELVKTKNELLTALKQAESLKNVTLEVKEIEKPQTPPLNITNDTMRQNTKVGESTVKLATMNNLNYFNNLASDSEDEEDDDDSPDPETDKDEDEDEDEDEEEEEKEEEEGDDVDVVDVEIDGENYLATDTENGTIYKVDSDGEILYDENDEFVKAGYFKDGISFIL